MHGDAVAPTSLLPHSWASGTTVLELANLKKLGPEKSRKARGLSQPPEELKLYIKLYDQETN